jgi:hypothetical protein
MTEAYLSIRASSMAQASSLTLPGRLCAVVQSARQWATAAMCLSAAATQLAPAFESVRALSSAPEFESVRALSWHAAPWLPHW